MFVSFFSNFGRKLQNPAVGKATSPPEQETAQNNMGQKQLPENLGRKIRKK